MTDFFGGHSFTLDGTRFVSGYGTSSVDQFFVLKSIDQLNAYRRIASEFRGGRMMELGIAAGGSAALLSLIADPSKLVAIELDINRVEALDDFIAARQFTDRVRPLYGVNQADSGALLNIARTEFGDAPLDLVIDDASHLLAETTSSFETLFPLLREGGVYVIEDWNSWHLLADGAGGPEKDGAVLPVPLSPLLIELMLVRASTSELVTEIVIGDLWASIRRGPAHLDAGEFRITDHFTDHFSLARPRNGSR